MDIFRVGIFFIFLVVVSVSVDQGDVVVTIMSRAAAMLIMLQLRPPFHNVDIVVVAAADLVAASFLYELLLLCFDVVAGNRIRGRGAEYF